MARLRWMAWLLFGLVSVAVATAVQQPAQESQPAAPQAKVTNPHGALATPCQECHTYTSWKPIRSNPEFNHDETGYPLRGMHAKVACTQCHTNLNFKKVSSQCSECHADIHRRQFGANCESCHSVRGWQASLNEIRDHQNRFPLVGAHAVLQCNDCHKNAAAGQITGLSTACFSCHQQEFQTKVIDHVAGNFPTTCESCHTMNTWFNAKFDHLKITGYALTGAHATLPCTACHVNNVYKGTPATCYACHTKDFTGAASPNHVAAGFPTDCAQCHTTTAWMPSTFNHTSVFPLTGAHATVTCAQCHINNNYTTLPTNCYGCHQQDWNGTTNPNHISAAFPTTCETCHTTTDWTNVNFNHAVYAKYALTGAHATLTCTQCHVDNNYTSTSTACVTCHQQDFNGTTSPSHVSSGFPTDCSMCHTTTAWAPSSFNHNNTVFPLTGAHTTVQCAQCHVNNNYTTLPTTCYGCHQADFTSTNSPAHVVSGFPTDCTLCHTTTAWSPSTFNHASVFALTGAHATLTCAQCHTNNNYTTLPTTCYGCHQSDWAGATNPNHITAAFPTTCDTCHTTTAWTPVNFNHAQYANYPLTGAHATLTCAQCHTNNNYSNLPTACVTCHQADFNGTTSPNHVTSGFPTDCSICHSTTAWSPSSFNHNSTAFPLTGAHTTVACTQCHVNNNYTTLPTTCYGCHQSDWAGTNDPGHAAAGFPTTCDTCHTTTAWTGASFNHNNTPFPLTGAHTSVDCVKCHVNNVFAGTPTTCYGCHQADYTGTTSPNHVSANWPTTCNTCHTTTAWTPATLSSSYHTWFPMNHGSANGVCTSCHTNSSDYSVFTCTTCHSASATNPNHKGVSGYVYNSANCYACHKNGQGG